MCYKLFRINPYFSKSFSNNFNTYNNTSYSSLLRSLKSESRTRKGKFIQHTKLLDASTRFSSLNSIVQKELLNKEIDSNNKVLFNYSDLYKIETSQIKNNDPEEDIVDRNEILHIISTGPSNNETLQKLSRYYFNSNGKMLRPNLVLLMSKAISFVCDYSKFTSETKSFNDVPLSNNLQTKFNDKIENIDYLINDKITLKLKQYKDKSFILPKQQRLAHITELIHTASLFHDDVIDNASVRRNKESVNIQFGNKLSILGGDFLLSRASVALARLRNVKCVELLATVISDLVEGELIQTKELILINENQNKIMERYLRKIYLKTASLFANSCRAAVVLNPFIQDHRFEEMAYEYGKNLGLAFQITDDLLDIVGEKGILGKENNIDFENGISTAPLIFALSRNGSTKNILLEILQRKCSLKDDTMQIKKIIIESGALDKTKDLARDYCNKALSCLKNLPDSSSKKCLEETCKAMLTRTY